MKRIKIKFFFQGNQFYIQKRFDEALASYNMAIKHNPTYSMAYYNRGSVLDDLNRLEEAIASYDMAIKHNPTDSSAYNNKGFSLYKLASPFYKLTTMAYGEEYGLVKPGIRDPILLRYY